MCPPFLYVFLNCINKVHICINNVPCFFEHVVIK